MELGASRSRKALVVFNYIFCVLVGFLCLAPVIHVLALSLSAKEQVIAGNVTLWPKGLTLDNYRYVARDYQFYSAFFVSIKRTALALVVVMAMTILAAYPLSMTRQQFKPRRIYIWLFVIPMIFSGGLIPTYLAVTKTGLINSIWALILPVAVPVYNVILLQNFMKALPDAITEAAHIDGADHFTTLSKVILPLCLPSLATLSLFVAVGHWNAWYDGMLYINDNLKFPLQTYLRTVVVQVNLDQINDLNTLSNRVATVAADSAKVFLALVPMLIVYPFAQKYFIHGIVQGSVKE